MINKLLLVFIIFLILIANIKRHYKHRKTSPYVASFLTTRQKLLSNSFHNKNLALLLSAFVSGNKKKISKSSIFKYKQNYLMHLFTPSGLHMSAMCLPIFLLINISNKKKKKQRNRIKIFFLILCTSVYLLPGYYSLKRIIIFYLLSLIIKEVSPYLRDKNIIKDINIFNNFNIFLTTFFLDYLLGGWSSSPLSFSLSFLFLGSLISSKHKLGSYINLSLAQLLFCHIINQKFNLFYSLSGIALSTFFSTIFPILFLNYLFPTYNFSEYILSVFNKLVMLY